LPYATAEYSVTADWQRDFEMAASKESVWHEVSSLPSIDRTYFSLLALSSESHFKFSTIVTYSASRTTILQPNHDKGLGRVQQAHLRMRKNFVTREENNDPRRLVIFLAAFGPTVEMTWRNVNMALTVKRK
jgi:hypothetical protein